MLKRKGNKTNARVNKIHTNTNNNNFSLTHSDRRSPPPSYSLLRPKMDWEGQKLAEQLMQIMLLSFAVIAFGAGYIMASFQTMILTYAGGVVLTTLVTLPNWPFFNHHPLKWLDPSEAEKHPKPQPSVNVTAKKKSIKK
ncbi:putative signal peptidase complex subunit [Trifolium repens]|nr:putative signal peptidase complex subunit [Trifolium repens]